MDAGMARRCAYYVESVFDDQLQGYPGGDLSHSLESVFGMPGAECPDATLSAMMSGLDPDIAVAASSPDSTA